MIFPVLYVVLLLWKQEESFEFDSLIHLSPCFLSPSCSLFFKFLFFWPHLAALRASSWFWAQDHSWQVLGTMWGVVDRTGSTACKAGRLPLCGITPLPRCLYSWCHIWETNTLSRVTDFLPVSPSYGLFLVCGFSLCLSTICRKGRSVLTGLSWNSCWKPHVIVRYKCLDVCWDSQLYQFYVQISVKLSLKISFFHSWSFSRLF